MGITLDSRVAPTVRRRGRPQHLPVDARDSHDPQIDAMKRTAWLLVTNRLLRPSTASMSRAAFVAVARTGDVALDATKLSRWESGLVPVPVPAVARYEQVARLPAGVLTGTHLMIQRLGGAEDRAVVEGNTSALDVAFERIDSDQATGGDWLDLAQQMLRFENMYLHADSWSLLCRRLVNELTRSGGIAFVRRFEAAALLMRHPAARRHLARSLGAFVMHPDVQHVTPTLSLLSEMGDQAAGDLVLRLIQEPNAVLRGGALRLAAMMASRGQLTASSSSTLEAAVRNELAKPGAARHTAALELATHLPTSHHGRIRTAIAEDRTREEFALATATSELVRFDVARRIADRVASHAENAIGRSIQDPDQMLRKLVREGLFHVQHQRRAVAAAMISASPYARPVAVALLTTTRDPDERVAEMSWQMLCWMSHVLDRAELIEHIDVDRSTPRAAAYLVLGLARGALGAHTADAIHDTSRVSATSGRTSYAALFALGMAGDGHLERLSRLDQGNNTRAAQWWRETGSVLHDTDEDPSPR